MNTGDAIFLGMFMGVCLLGGVLGLLEWLAHR